MKKVQEIHGGNLLKELKDTFSTPFKERKEGRNKDKQRKKQNGETERKKGTEREKNIYNIHIYERCTLNIYMRS